MTPTQQFRNKHGDPSGWSSADIDSYQVIADNQAHQPERLIREEIVEANLGSQPTPTADGA